MNKWKETKGDTDTLDNETKRNNTENEPSIQRMNEKMQHRNTEATRQWKKEKETIKQWMNETLKRYYITPRQWNQKTENWWNSGAQKHRATETKQREWNKETEN